MIPDTYSVVAYCNAIGAKKSTADMYRHAIARYSGWLRQVKGLGIPEATDLHAIEFEGYLRTDAQLAGSTIQAYMRNVYRYLIWLADNGVIDRAPAFRVQSRQKHWSAPSTVSVIQMRHLLESARDDRAWCLLALLAFSGIKTPDLLNCDVSDLNLEGNEATLYLQRTQGRLPFTILHPVVSERLQSYIGERRSGAIFTTRGGTRLSRNAVGGILETTSRRAGLSFRLTAGHLNYFLPLHSLEEGFSYRSVIRAIGIVQPNQASRWLQTMSHRDASHAAVRMARIVLNPPEATESLLTFAGAILDETDLPESFTVGAVGAIFERHLRLLCIGLRIEGVPDDPKRGSIAKYTTLLHGHKAITLSERQQCEQLQEWRNQAAHGNFDALAPGDAIRALEFAMKMARDHRLL